MADLRISQVVVETVSEQEPAPGIAESQLVVETVSPSATDRTAPGIHRDHVFVDDAPLLQLAGPDAFWYDGFQFTDATGELPVSQFWADGFAYNFGPTPEPSGTHIERVTVTEGVTAALVGGAPTLNVNRFDTITVTEFVQTDLNALLRASVADAITVSEFVKTSLSLTAKVHDAITVTDVVTAQLRPTLRVLATDAITVAESVRAGISLGARVSDAITVAESVTGLLVTAKVGIDAITVSEFVKAVLSPTVYRVNDRVTVTDSRAATISGPLTVFKFETINVVEGSFNPKVVLNQLIIDSDLPPTPFTAGDYWVVGIT